MSEVNVKQHTRKTKKGNLAIVKQHEREVELKEPTMAERMKSLLYRKIADKATADAMWAKYKDYPLNLKIMLNAKWHDATIQGKDGQKKTVKRITFTDQQWMHLFRENGGLAYKIIKRYNWKPELFDDLKSVSRKAIFDAVNNYYSKYNPKNPYDIQRHLAVQIRGYVQAEMAQQMAVAINLPYHKKVLFSKFKHYHDLYEGDYDKIYEAMNLTKGDMYPDLKKSSPKEAAEKLPLEGYVSVNKEGVVAKKLETHNAKVETLRKNYEDELTKLELKKEQMLNTHEDVQMYNRGLKILQDQIDKTTTKLLEQSKDYYTKINDYESKIDDVNEKITKEEEAIALDPNYSNKKLIAFSKIKEKLQLDLQVARKNDNLNKLRDQVKKQKNDLLAYSVEMKPLTEEEYGSEKARIENNYQVKLRQAKAEFDKEVGKTQIQGAHKLFDQFEEIMSLRELRLNDAIEDEESEGRSLEEQVKGDMLSPEEQLQITEEYLHKRDILDDALNTMSPLYQKVMRLYLGLDEANDMQAHGLWGKPMQINEMYKHVPTALLGDNLSDKADYNNRLAAWEKQKPTKTGKFKLDPKEFDAKVKVWTKNRDAAKKAIKKLAEKDKRFKELKGAAKERARQIVYEKYQATDEHFPKKFTEAKLSTKEYNAKLKEWEAKKPNEEIGDETKYLHIRKAIEIGKQALRRLMDKRDANDLMYLHRQMIAHGLKLKKGDVEFDIVKAIDDFFTDMFELTYIG